MNVTIGFIWSALVNNRSMDPKSTNRGIPVDITITVCQALGLNCIFAPFNGTEFGTAFENGTGTGLIGAIQRGIFDTSVPVFTPNYKRIRAVAFSDAYFYTDYVMITRSKKLISVIDLAMISAISWQTWCIFIALLMCTGLCVSVFSKKEAPKSPLYLLQYAVTSVPALITHKHCIDSSKSDSIRVLIISWSMGAFVFSCGYTSMLFSERLIEDNTLPFRDMITFGECLKTGQCRLVVPTKSVSYFEVMQEMTDIRDALITNPPLIVPQTDKIPRMILQEENTYLVWLAPMEAYDQIIGTNEECRFYYIQMPYSEVWAFPVRKNSGLLKMLNRMAVPFREQGLAKSLSDKYRSPDLCLHVQHTVRELNSKSSAYAAMCFLATGLLVASFAFICEWITNEKKRSLHFAYSRE